MTVKKFALFIIIPVLILSFVIYFLTKKDTVPVKKVFSQNTNVYKTVSASGFINAPIKSDLAFPLSGKIVSINKKEGDKVMSGELIAQVFNEDSYYTAESARKRKDSAQKARDIYVTTYYDRQNRVGGSDIYEANVDKLTDELRIQDNLYKSALSDLKKSYVYAPFDGTITKLPYNVGEVVSINDTITLSNLNSLEFQADLDQEDYKYVALNQETEVSLDSYNDIKFSGKVISVPFYVDEESQTRTFKIKISIENKDNLAVKGMTGDASIIVSKAENVRALPFDAIFTDSDTQKTYVWTVDSNNNLSKFYVDIGLEGDTLTEIKNEIPEFVVVPTSSSSTVSDGAVASF